MTPGARCANASAISSVALAFSPDGSTLVSGADEDGTVQSWNVATRRPVGQPLADHTKNVNSVAFSRDGRTAATLHSDGTVRLWDIAGRRLLGRPLKAPADFADGAVFSPDGEKLAAVVSQPTGTAVRLWQVATQRSLGPAIKGHDDAERGSSFGPALALSRDGRMLAAGGFEDWTVRLWDLAARRPLGEPLEHNEEAAGVAFNRDGRTLATGDFGTVRLWDVATRRPLGQPLRGHTDYVQALAFSPDDRTLASGDLSGNVRVWDSILWSDDVRALRNRLCSSVWRDLTAAEWEEFLPDEPRRKTCTHG
jgi:WD40 repeat protein